MNRESYSGVKLVNNVLHPWIVLAIVVAIITYITSPETLGWVGWTFSILASAFVPVYVYTLVKFRRLQRAEKISTGIRDTFRNRPWELLISAFVFGIPPILLILFLDRPDEILVLFVVTTAVMFFIALLNFVYRASFHLALLTTSIFSLWLLTDVLSLATLPLIFIAGFLRYRLGAHTVGQLCTGVILGVVVTLLVFYGFGFIR